MGKISPLCVGGYCVGTVFENDILKRRELRLFGVSGFNGAQLALGRLYPWSAEFEKHSPESSVIYISRSADAARALSLLTLIRPSALILTPSAISAKLLGVLISASIPYLILKDTHLCLEAHKGRVALLDTKNDVLIIDPQIDTLNSYPLDESVQSRLEDERVFFARGYLLKERDEKALLLDAHAVSERGELFELLTELAESPYAPPVSIELPVPVNGRERESFCESVEAIFRAAIYGVFSVLLSGFNSEKDISVALACMHEVFCSLEENGREFNGYIKKGLVIDAPIWLMRPSPLKKPDLVCFDAEKLQNRLFGSEAFAFVNSSEAQNELYRAWEHYLSFFAPDCPMCAKLSSHTPHKSTEGFLSFAQIREIYAPER